MAGTALVGTPSKSPLFDAKIKLATTTPQYSLLTSKWLRKKLEARNIHGDEPELAQLSWDTTLQEVESGFWRVLSKRFMMSRKHWEALASSAAVLS